ncbi:hypothetical protein BRADI_1g63616v3 [Brachypodium distachyon]|uniref:Uncharacterized protein n=1 Tax=Brachypodium distachyon TaxID=15368 RepID=A0A2K2DT81_BRADI|nr:hypothetical protein BRADI_1g63616v3 [Brachypodium distachyon]
MTASKHKGSTEPQTCNLPHTSILTSLHFSKLNTCVVKLALHEQGFCRTNAPGSSLTGAGKDPTKKSSDLLGKQLGHQQEREKSWIFRISGDESMGILGKRRRKGGTGLTGPPCRSPATLNRSNGEDVTGQSRLGPRETTSKEMKRRQLAKIYKAHTLLPLPLRPAAPAEERGRGKSPPTGTTKKTRGRWRVRERKSGRSVSADEMALYRIR